MTSDANEDERVTFKAEREHLRREPRDLDAALVAACLELDHARAESAFLDPRRPGFLDELIIRGLRPGDASADVRVERDAGDLAVSVPPRTGGVRVVQVK